MPRLIPALLLLSLAGCAAFVDSFRTKPGQEIITLPTREYTLDMRFSVSVIVRQDGGRPYCSLPDAGNEISCEFSYEWFNEGGFLIIGSDGYRGLTQPTAREACRQAMWTAQGGHQEIDACARALLYHRFVVAPPVDEPRQ